MPTRWSEHKERRKRDPAEVRHGYEQAAIAYHFGETVRRMRLEAGLTQVQLAQKMNTTQPVIARLEAGGVDPKLSTLTALARVLGQPIVIEAPSEPTPA